MRAIALLMLACCACVTPRAATSTSTPPCVRPLLSVQGYAARGGQPIYVEYGWSRAGRYNASLESALSDHPDLLARLHHFDKEAVIGGGLILGGTIGTFFGVGAAMFSAAGGQPGDPPSEPTLGIALGDIALGAISVALGSGLYTHGERRWSKALHAFNAEAEQQGCHPSPLP
jgi:hypothetical protein